MGKIPQCIGQQVAFVQDYIILPKTGLCHLCYHTIEGDHKVKNKERYQICPKCNLTTQLRFSIMFCKTKLKLMEFVMMLYCYTALNISNTHKRDKATLSHMNKDKKHQFMTTLEHFMQFVGSLTEFESLYIFKQQKTFGYLSN